MLSLWQMGLSASAVILLAALLRRLTGSRLPRRMYVALWDVALLSGLIPFRLTIPMPRVTGSIGEALSGAVRTASRTVSAVWIRPA